MGILPLTSPALSLSPLPYLSRPASMLSFNWELYNMKGMNLLCLPKLYRMTQISFPLQRPLSPSLPLPPVTRILRSSIS